MKAKLFYLATLFMLLLSACGDNDEPSSLKNGSPRDWSYTNSQVKFYINNVEQTSVSEITVSSTQLTDFGDASIFPWYDTTLRVKGLFSNKKKIFNINVKADVERFEGITVLEGTEYDVTGEFTGDPFEHYTKMGIVVYLTEK
ncbi:MAG: hypothetical protein HDR88_03375 [Bacteroides sp.]|nr:hypothetical protein [Bacteroides sp.]